MVTRYLLVNHCQFVHRLVVKCSSYKACRNFDIYCPEKESAICDVRCLDDETCSPTYAYIEKGYQLHTNFSIYPQNVIFRCDADETDDCVAIYDDADKICTYELRNNTLKSWQIDCGASSNCSSLKII